MKSLILYFFLSTHLFGQNVQGQKKYTRIQVITKYLFNSFTTTKNFIQNQRLENYEKFSINQSRSHEEIDLETKKEKKCSIVCPKSFDILKLNKSNYEQNEYNSLNFLNEAKDFEDIMKRDYGFCWGHSSLTNQLRHLAFFDPTNSRNLLHAPKYSKEWREYVLESLDAIFNFKVRVIPYVRNIRELSELFEDKMKNLVIKKWGQNAITIDNYFARFRNEKVYSKKEIIEMMSTLEKRLARGETPELIFTSWGSSKWLHVVLVTKVRFNEFNSTYSIELDDNKLYNNISSLIDHQSMIEIDLKDQKIIYNNGDKFLAPSKRVGRLAITSRNYQMYNYILPELRSFCIKETHCQE